MAHNHPSGDPAPSKLDRELTRELLSAGEALHIPVLDHLIIGTSHPPYYSFREHGFIST